MRCKFFGGVLGSIFQLLLFSAAAGATILPINTSVAPSLGTETGTLIAKASGSYSTPSIAGEVTEGVYANSCPTGTCLDFVYQFTETSAGNPVTQMTMSDFDNIAVWSTDVQYATSNTGALSIFSPPGGVNPTPARAGKGGKGPDQSVTIGGDTVSFTMTDGGCYSCESDILIIKTNAPKYIVGSVSLIGSNTATAGVPAGNSPWTARYAGSYFGTITNGLNTGAYAYNGVGYVNSFLAPIPEPGFYGILAIGLAGLFLAVKYRRNKQTT
jgi:hypothetical protein